MNLGEALSNSKCTIFLSHSSKDTELIRLIELAFAGREIEPYFAKQRMEGKNPVAKIVEAITNSIGLFALITPAVVEDTYTRDWVVFEIGVAKAKEVPIFCWLDESIDSKKSYPRLIENITDYDNFNCQNIDSCIVAANSIRDKAFKLTGLTRKASDFNDKQLKTGLTQIEKAQAIAEKSLPEKGTNVIETRSSGETEQTSFLLPDNTKIADLKIDNNFLDELYESAQNLAKAEYYDAQLSSFSINVFPFISNLSRVSIYFDFFSSIGGRICTFKFSDGNPKVVHCPPDKQARDDLSKKVLKNLPWKESPEWKQFLQISIAKTGQLPPNDMTRYVLMAFPWGIEDLGKTDVFWSVSVVDNFSGNEHSLRWNGKTIAENNIKQDY